MTFSFIHTYKTIVLQNTTNLVILRFVISEFQKVTFTTACWKTL